MTDIGKLTVIKASLEAQLKNSFESYIENPSADNYQDLEDIMLAWQRWEKSGSKERAEMANALWTKSIGAWVPYLANLTRDEMKKLGVKA